MFKKLTCCCTFLVVFTFFSSIAQEKKLQVNGDIQENNNDYNPLSPAKAAFYSAVLPGLGQAYNKKYWKIPFVYAALGTTTYFYITNNNEYKRYRTAFKQRKLGKIDEFTNPDGTQLISISGLERAQRTLKKNKDLSLLLTVAAYALQIVEASANAHLLQFNMDNDISFDPQLFKDPITNNHIVGLSLNYSF